MLGATPSMNKDFLSSMGFDITLGGRSNKFLSALVRNQRINASAFPLPIRFLLTQQCTGQLIDMPILYQYADECISGLGATTDPFDTIYKTIFRLVPFLELLIDG
jgi:hypothetical protein